ncbi:hypothetical protein [Mucilaginibacter sp. L3T2-6]|uniref:hypothetical protein n=1 Tax=Mucilaginibacter sp. L3T2-6 TaxID=3062491 RepID=UPI002676F9F5|nr:hypothetical protein [Mucilaginibacter sp. L3T2-6]MDO3645219.1 hypothetical protein [Mucilaginibacter sp. L3T2-6]MDV6217671.1 hypothetical protein [Mucilaginibacter sp. L3T2-6]
MKNQRQQALNYLGKALFPVLTNNTAFDYPKSQTDNIHLMLASVERKIYQHGAGIFEYDRCFFSDIYTEIYRAILDYFDIMRQHWHVLTTLFNVNPDFVGTLFSRFALKQ